MKHGLADYANKVMLVEAVAIRAPKAYSSSSSGTGWQSQNATDPSSKRGDDIIRHAALGIDIHLFVRDSKLAAGKAAPFTYHGRVRYQSHEGSRPMSIVFGLDAAAG